MTFLSSIFSFDTLKPGRNRIGGLPLSLLLAGAVLGTGELGARFLLSKGKIEEDKSLRLLVESRLHEMDTAHPTLWMLGNSTLDWGIDEKQFEAGTGTNIVKLSHGSATVQASAEMLEYYFRHTESRPDEVIFTTTKDDFNAHGSRNTQSARYHEIHASDSLPYTDPFVLRNARTDIRQKALPWVFVEKEEKVARFNGNAMPLDHDALNELVHDFTFQVDWLDGVRDVCHKNGVKKLTVILLPVTDRNVEFHNAKIASPTYDQIVKGIADRCVADDIDFVNWGNPPRNDYAKFRDSYHLNPAGMKWQTDRLIQLRTGKTTMTTGPATKPAALLQAR